MLDFTFTDALSARLEAGVRASVDFTPVMGAIADKMRSNAVLNFEAESGPDGVKWLRSQRAEADGGLTLTDTGMLRQSIVAGSDATSAIAGTNLIYAAIHQFGGAQRSRQSARSQNLPRPRQVVARPFLGFSEADVADFGQMLENYLDGAMNGGRA